jgi:predicted small secreted protein
MKKALALIVAGSVITATFLLLAGCETTKGVGRDIERLGEKMQDVIDPQ